MKNHTWTKEELMLLGHFNQLRNSHSSMPMELRTKNMEKECLFTEAKLCISNKYVVGYSNRKKMGVFSFTEIAHHQWYCRSKGEIFTYHPVNFKTFLEHQAYLVKHKA